jgi:hypothetical protein
MDDAPFICPYCESELALPDDVWYFTCPQCNNRLDLKSQFAYLRGLDAFSEGQDIIQSMSPRKRQVHDPRVKEAMALFKKAYSSIQVAFLTHLEEKQRSLGVEMMSSMTGEFLKWNLISPLESNYWQTLLVEQKAQDEYDQIKQKLAELGGPLQMLTRLRWRMRQKQLIKALVDLKVKVEALENQIEFVDNPRARKKKWNP